MSRKKRKEEMKYNNIARINGLSPDNKCWKYTDSDWLNPYERRARGLIKNNASKKKIHKEDEQLQDVPTKTEIDPLVEEE